MKNDDSMEKTKAIKYPMATEKSVRLIQSENKIIFTVESKAKRSEIKKDVEKLFNSKVISVNTFVNAKGEKRAYVKFSDETPAVDIATQLGLM